MKTLICLLLLTLPGLLSAQGIVFEKSNWADVVKKAKKQKKLIFLQLDQPSCDQCSRVADMAFNSPLTREKFAQHFISFRVDGTTGIGKELSDKLEIECTPSCVYLDADESPLTRYCGTTSLDRTYLEKAEEAIQKSSETPLTQLAELYQQGDRPTAFIRTYIDRRREAGLSNSDMLDEYVRRLPTDSLQAPGLLRFIFEQGPIVGSRADQVFRANYPRTDSIYRAVGWNKAVELNNRITNNSLRKAIKEKDGALASRTAFFRQRTYTNDVKGGMAAREWVMMRYYRGVKDTAQYLNTAAHYYDTQFMTAKVDSLQKLDELENQRRMRGAMPPMPNTDTPARPGQVQPRIVSFVANPNTQRYVSALNQAAWEFQAMTRDTAYLQKALTWSKRSLEFREDGSLMDTYAHLLYRLGRKPEALEWQQKAIKLEKERNSPAAPSLEATLKKMQAGTL